MNNQNGKTGVGSKFASPDISSTDRPISHSPFEGYAGFDGRGGYHGTGGHGGNQNRISGEVNV